MRVVERFGPENVSARFADVKQENPDLYRFLDDVEAASGVKIERIGQGQNCWDVWLDRLMFTAQGTGGCVASYHLKKLPLSRHAERNYQPESTTIYVGFGIDEDDRKLRLIKAGAPWIFDFPLCWKPILSRCDVIDELRRRGITPTDSYHKGYPHDNCGGACILAGIGQWVGLLRDNPELFALNERKEQEFLERLRQRGRKPQTILKDRRGGVTQNLSLRQLRLEVESGVRHDSDSWRSSSCSCVGDLFTL